VCTECGTNSSVKWYKGPLCRKCYRVTRYKDKNENDKEAYTKKRIKNNLRTRVNHALNGAYKIGSAIDDLGCTVEELMNHLESQFLPGMTWENRGMHGWHVDHIKPLSSFDLTNEEEFKKACHYTNLQPLWAEDNLKKSNKYEDKTED